MKLFLRDQSARLADFLPEFRAATLSYTPDDLAKLPQHRREVCVLADGAPGAAGVTCDLREARLDFLFRYRLYPPGIMKSFGEWELENRDMRVGDTLVLQAAVPPWLAVAKMVFADRIVAVERTAERATFAYGTLAGHPEIGVNEFAFFRRDGALFASIHTTAAAAILRPLASALVEPYAMFCNAVALRTMKRKFLAENA